MQTHGIISTYNAGCRCEQCVPARTKYEAAYRKRDPEGRVRTHGTRGGYNAGCRCEECTVANRKYMALRRAKGIR